MLCADSVLGVPCMGHVVQGGTPKPLAPCARPQALLEGCLPDLMGAAREASA